MFSLRSTLERKSTDADLTTVPSTSSSIDSARNSIHSSSSRRLGRTVSLSRRLLSKLGYKRFVSDVSSIPPHPPPATKKLSSCSSTGDLDSGACDASWSALPLELQIEVMSFLTIRERVIFRQVNRAAKLIVEATPITSITATPRHVSLLGDNVIAEILERHASSLREVDLDWTNHCGPQMAKVIFSKCNRLQYINLGARSHSLFCSTELSLDVFVDWMSANKNTLQILSYPSLSSSPSEQLPVLECLASQSHTNLRSLQVPIIHRARRTSESTSLITTIPNIAKIIEISPQLRRLVLADNKGTRDIEPIARAIYTCSSLEFLELRHCLLTNNIFDAMLGTSQNSDFPEHTPLRKWKKLSLSSGHQNFIDDACFTHLIGHVPDLQYLKLEQASIKTTTLNNLLETTPRLRVLSISSEQPQNGQPNSLLGDAKLSLPAGLIHLNLHGSTYHKPQMMSHILQQCPELEDIDLTCSSIVGDADIAYLVNFNAQKEKSPVLSTLTSRQHPDFITISVLDCPQVTWQSVVKCLNHNQGVFRKKLECPGHPQYGHKLCNHAPLIRLLGHYRWRVQFEMHFKFCLTQTHGYEKLSEMTAGFKRFLLLEQSPTWPSS
ncbi:hypothetical protein BROUX41_001501 [Berkeleyomyces rouxiae]|uniref:uncharacterized protein n=1 Tax=Berkeleyomyces rouxiae TaxID=2035830 RepID=UPI003B7CAF65